MSWTLISSPEVCAWCGLNGRVPAPRASGLWDCAFAAPVCEAGVWRRIGRASLPSMAEPVPAGSDVSAGTYKCTNCGYRLQTGSTKHLPPCPSCHNGFWETITGGDSIDDPYPNK